MTATVGAAFVAVPPDSELRAADPLVEDGLYDRATALFDAFKSSAPTGIAGGKIHKVLHVKRPRLIPILDRKVRKLYAAPARVWRRRMVDQRSIPGHGYWAAIRDDLLDPVNAAALTSCRSALDDGTPFERRVATLSDLRLLDMVAWSLDV